MANPHHVRLVLESTSTFDKWRKAHPEFRLDLSGADFSEQSLRWKDLRGADLQGAIFVETELDFTHFNDADLRGAIFRGGQFSCATFENADLRGATFEEVDLNSIRFAGAQLAHVQFVEANLCGVDFRGAYLEETLFASSLLHGANFRGVALRGSSLGASDLREADFTQADFTGVNMVYSLIGGTTFGDVDLRPVEGLESITHRGRSTLGLDSFERSQGDIPLVFLRGCGLSDELIAALFAGLGRPVPPFINTALGARNPQGEHLPGLTAFRKIQAQMESVGLTSEMDKKDAIFRERPAYFLSCHLQDTDFAERLMAALQEHGIRCWVDDHLLAVGYRHLTDSGCFSMNSHPAPLRTRDKVLLCASAFLSPADVGDISTELKEAQTRETYPLNASSNTKNFPHDKMLLTLILDDHLLSDEVFRYMPEDEAQAEAKLKRVAELRERVVADFRGWRRDSTAFERGLTQLLDAIDRGDA